MAKIRDLAPQTERLVGQLTYSGIGGTSETWTRSADLIAATAGDEGVAMRAEGGTCVL